MNEAEVMEQSVLAVDRNEVESRYQKFIKRCAAREVELMDVAPPAMHARLMGHLDEYVAYGPYWYAFKRVMRSAGFDYGPAMDDQLADEFSVRDAAGNVDPGRTLTACDLFREFYFENYINRTAHFVLDAEGGRVLQLSDPDMQMRLQSRPPEPR